jgi:hypothetical protein
MSGVPALSSYDSVSPTGGPVQYSPILRVPTRLTNAISLQYIGVDLASPTTISCHSAWLMAYS